jgi:predicted dehydrogenase
MNPVDPNHDLTRRDFLRGGSFAAMLSALGAVELRAQDKPKEEGATQYQTAGHPVNIGVIGCGVWGREIIDVLSRLPNAPVVALCDTYEAFLRRANKLAAHARPFTDYKELLAQPDVQAVVVATPTHLHKEIVLAALQAGKHVYCEAPLAHTVEDARAIAAAARAAVKVNFQPGLQTRSDPQRHFLLEFVRTGAIGKDTMVRAQWHKKESWRRAAPSSEREREINWRLRRDVSTGLAGEIGIHPIDATNWFLNARPVSVHGFGSNILWKDGRDVPDTIQAVIEYENGVRMFYDCLLTNSFDGEYEMFYGTDAALMLRGSRAWLFKEVDSPLLGWEVYAKKEQFHRETGIVLVANATKLAAQTENPDDNAEPQNTALQSALASFVHNAHTHRAGVEDFISNFGDDLDGLKQYLATLKSARLPAAGVAEGLEATIIAVKTNEAIVKGQKITFDKAWFEA